MTSGSHGSEPPRYRRWRQFAAVLLVMVIVLGVIAWQQGSGGRDGGPLNAIAAAAEKTQEEPGGRAVMHSIVTPGRSRPFTMTGQMVFDAEDRARAVITVPRLETGGSMTVDAVTEGTVMYVRSSRFDPLPDGAEWMAFDFSLGDDLDTPVPASADVKGELALLEAVGDDVRKLGKEDVRGVPTTHYRGTLGVADQVKRMREEGADTLASISEERGSPFRVEAWIDAAGLVRRMRLVHSQPAEDGEGPVTIDMRVDFFDFGIEPEIDLPESSEVFDATALAKEKLGVDD